MALLSIVYAIALGVTVTGAYRIWEHLVDLLADFVSVKLSQKIAFVAVSMMAAAMVAPFLTPASLELQFGVWIFYLTFFGVGSWRLYEFGCIVRTALRNKRNAR
jgi:hypothetical protein